MFKLLLRIALACVLVICGTEGARAASSRGSHGSHGGGHSGGGGHSHGGGHSGGRSHGGGSFHGGGSHGMSSHGSTFRGGSSHMGGGASRHSVGAFRGGSFSGLRGRNGMSRGSFSQNFGSRRYSNTGSANFRGNGWTGSGPSQGHRMSAGNLPGRGGWGQQRSPSRTSRGFSFDGSGSRGSRPNWAASYSRGGTSWDRPFGRSSSFDSNRPSSRQFGSMNRSSRVASNGWGRRTSVGADRFDGRGSFGGSRAFDRKWAPSSASRFGGASTRGFGPRNTLRTARSYGSDRPADGRRSELGNLSGRGNSSWANRSRFGANGGRSNFGGSRFSGRGRFENASFSRFGNRGFSGSRGYGFRHDGFRRGGWGYGGFRQHGYGFGGWGGDPWWDDLWFLGDLFGLALDFGRLAITPAWGIAGWGLLDAGLQALNSNDDVNGNSYGDDDNGRQYDSLQYDDNDQFYATRAQWSYPPLCGRYYSDENPGCRQQF